MQNFFESVLIKKKWIKINSSTSWPDGEYILILGWPIPLILPSILGLHTEQSDWGNLFGNSNLSSGEASQPQALMQKKKMYVPPPPPPPQN